MNEARKSRDVTNNGKISVQRSQFQIDFRGAKIALVGGDPWCCRWWYSINLAYVAEERRLCYVGFWRNRRTHTNANTRARTQTHTNAGTQVCSGGGPARNRGRRVRFSGVAPAVTRTTARNAAHNPRAVLSDVFARWFYTNYGLSPCHCLRQHTYTYTCHRSPPSPFPRARFRHHFRNGSHHQVRSAMLLMIKARRQILGTGIVTDEYWRIGTYSWKEIVSMFFNIDINLLLIISENILNIIGTPVALN